jgi:AcrR family transcriptional regulator
VVQDPPARRSRREERKEETRRELIASAAATFARRGFQGASLDEIARAAGYSTGAIYWHFKGKDDLFLAVFEAYAESRVAEIARVREASSGNLAQTQRALADNWTERLAANPEMVVLALEFAAHAWRNEELRAAFAERMAIVRRELGANLEEDARRAGVELPLPPRDVATALREMGVGLALAKLGEPAIRGDLFADFVETYFRMIAERNA